VWSFSPLENVVGGRGAAVGPTACASWSYNPSRPTRSRCGWAPSGSGPSPSLAGSPTAGSPPSDSPGPSGSRPCAATPLPDLLTGSVNQILDQLHGYRELGFTGFNLVPSGPDRTDQMHRIAEDVVPGLRDACAPISMEQSR
jgi:hypothetical protein